MAYPDTGADLNHLFVPNNTAIPNDFIDENSDDTKQDAAIYNKQKADWGSEIDRDSAQLNGKENTNPDDNPAQPGNYEYKGASAVKGYVLRSGKRLEGSKVILEQKVASGRSILEGIVLAQSDEYPAFAVRWSDGQYSVEARKNYTLKDIKS